MVIDAYLVFHEKNNFATQCSDDIISLFLVAMPEYFHQVEMSILCFGHINGMAFKFIK